MTSIRLRLTVGVAVLLAAGLGIYGGLFHTVVNDWLRPDALALAKDKTMRLGRWVKPEPLTDNNLLQAWIRNEAQGYHWALLDLQGNPVQQSRLLPECFPLPEAARAVTNQLSDAHAELRRGSNGALYAVAWYPVMVVSDNTLRARITGWTEAVVPLEPLLARQRRLGWWLVTVGSGALVLGGGLAYYLTGLWLRPWRTVAVTARGLREGALADARIPPVTDDADLGRVVEAFNVVLDRLRAAEARQQQFVADAAHELRTPLAALRAEIEVALRRPRSTGEYQQTLQLNRLELERLGALVENLLALVRLDGQAPAPERAPTNLAVVCRDVVEALTPLAAAHQVRLELEVPDELVIPADALALERALRNLVENALKHTPAGEAILIRSTADASEARLVVHDQGVGIAPEHLARLFDRFYRVDTARNRAHGGAGLGLAIVKAIAEAHGGSVQVESTLGQGSTFTVRLPRQNPPR